MSQMRNRPQPATRRGKDPGDLRRKELDDYLRSARIGGVLPPPRSPALASRCGTRTGPGRPPAAVQLAKQALAPDGGVFGDVFGWLARWPLSDIIQTRSTESPLCGGCIFPLPKQNLWRLRCHRLTERWTIAIFIGLGGCAVSSAGLSRTGDAFLGNYQVAREFGPCRTGSPAGARRRGRPESFFDNLVVVKVASYV